MPGCSAFRRCGNGFRCSSRRPLGEILYRQIVEANGGVFGSEGFTGPVAARSFALAMTVARARTTLERAANQADPQTMWDLLKDFENHYGITPGPGATLGSRRDAVDAAMQLTLGPKRGNIEYQLRTALGDDFVAYVTSSGGASTPFPDDPAAVGIFGNPPAWKSIRLNAPITALGTPFTVPWFYEAGDDGALVVGDELVVQPGELGQQERVVVTARSDTTFTASFARPHEAGVLALRQPWPFWMSTQKNSAVVVKHGRASDLVLRETVRNILHKLLGDTSIWDVVEENAVAGHAGPMIPGAGTWLLGQTPMGTLTTV